MFIVLLVISVFTVQGQDSQSCNLPDFVGNVSTDAQQQFIGIISNDSLSQYQRDLDLTTWATDQGGNVPTQTLLWRIQQSSAATEFNNNITTALLLAPGSWIQLLANWQNIFITRAQQISQSEALLAGFDPRVRAILLAAAAPETHPRGPGAVIGECGVISTEAPTSEAVTESTVEASSESTTESQFESTTVAETTSETEGSTSESVTESPSEPSSTTTPPEEPSETSSEGSTEASTTANSEATTEEFVTSEASEASSVATTDTQEASSAAGSDATSEASLEDTTTSAGELSTESSLASETSFLSDTTEAGETTLEETDFTTLTPDFTIEESSAASEGSSPAETTEQATSQGVESTTEETPTAIAFTRDE